VKNSLLAGLIFFWLIVNRMSMCDDSECGFEERELEV